STDASPPSARPGATRNTANLPKSLSKRSRSWHASRTPPPSTSRSCVGRRIASRNICGSADAQERLRGMASLARGGSVDALKRLRVALLRFCEVAERALGEADNELSRTLEWVD